MRMRSAGMLAALAATSMIGSPTVITLRNEDDDFVPRGRTTRHRGLGNGNLHLSRDLTYTHSEKPMSKRRKRRLRGKAKA